MSESETDASHGREGGTMNGAASAASGSKTEQRTDCQGITY